MDALCSVSLLLYFVLVWHGGIFLWCQVGECVPSDSLSPIVLTSDPAVACGNRLVELCYLFAFRL